MSRPYNKTIWQDHVTEHENRYIEQANPDGTVTLVPVEGEVIQQGTPQNAANFNNIENGIFGAHELNAVIAQQLLQHKRILADLEGEIGQVALNNTQEYPFNNSGTTVSLKKPRDTMNYRVTVEVLSSNGQVGEVYVYDKQLNGFKIRYTGSAKQATIKYYVQGGMYQ